MKRIILMLLSIFGVSHSAETESLFRKSVLDGIEKIKLGEINNSMNLIRRGINCFYVEGGKYDATLSVMTRGLIDNEGDKRRKAAYLVYIAVIELTNPSKEPGKIIEFLNRAQSEDATLPEIYNTRAIVHVGNKDYDKALVDYSKAIELNPKYLDAWSNRAMTYHKLGKIDLAVADYSRYQDLLNSIYYANSPQGNSPEPSR